MNHKLYSVLILVVITGAVLVKNNSQESSVSIEKIATDATSTEEKINRQKNSFGIADNEQHQLLKNISTNNQKPTTTIEKTGHANNSKLINPHEASESSMAINETQFSEIASNPENANVAATGEFVDQVNLPSAQDDCTEPCDDLGNKAITDGSKANIPVVGKFADQINTDAIVDQTQQIDPNRPLESKIPDISKTPTSPTKTGIYSPAQ